MPSLQRTVLYPEYEKHHAKTIDFGGWDLPVQFSSILNEHEAARTKAALFDVSHMGEIRVEGPDSLIFLQKMMTNDVKKLAINQAQYTFMCNPDGGTIDDLLIYRRDEDDYLLVVNAANTDKDFSWLQEHLDDERVTITNESAVFALIAIQGPFAEEILQKAVTAELKKIRPFRFEQGVKIGDAKTEILSRTGYTGEDGFEIYIHPSYAREIWQKLLEIGEKSGLVPAGLGARDSLRFEAGLPLYGQELSEDISPVEAGLTFAVKVNKEVDFIGKTILQNQIEAGTARKLVGIAMEGKGIPRTGYAVLDEQEKQIGYVTTGTRAPTLKKPIGFAMIDESCTAIGTKVKVQIRKRQVEAIVVPTPFYRR